MDAQIKEAQSILRRDAPAPPELLQETLWSRLYQSHCARMYRIARQITQNDAEAEDAVQQAFVRLLSALDAAPDPDSPQTRALLSIGEDKGTVLLSSRATPFHAGFADFCQSHPRFQSFPNRLVTPLPDPAFNLLNTVTAADFPKPNDGLPIGKPLG